MTATTDPETARTTKDATAADVTPTPIPLPSTWVDAPADPAQRAPLSQPDEFHVFTGEGVRPLHELFTEVHFTPGAGEEYAAGGMYHGLRGLVPFVHDGPTGFSLVRVHLAPDFILPAHRHDSDCLYYVVQGTAILGKRVLGPGAGFFVPADTVYGYKAGPEGAEVLEFRHATSFDFVETETSPSRWEKIAENSREHGDWKDHVGPFGPRLSTPAWKDTVASDDAHT